MYLPFQLVGQSYTMDNCGCKQHHYDKENFCNKPNEKAANKTCHDKCYKKRVIKGKCLDDCAQTTLIWNASCRKRISNSFSGKILAAWYMANFIYQG